MATRVFADFHHGDLYESLCILFEDRLGWELYRPIGMEWYEEGYWDIAKPYGNSPDTARQFLEVRGGEWDMFSNLNGTPREVGGVYYVHDPLHNRVHRCLTLPAFRDFPIDIIVSTHPLHDDTYTRLRDRYKPRAKRIAQLGNWGQGSRCENVMSSVKAHGYVRAKNYVFYHQEFSLRIFYPEPPQHTRVVSSFVNCLPLPEVYHAISAAAPFATWRAYGMACPHGFVTGLENIAALMRASDMGYHVKPTDGYGHILHNWFACGRPVITRVVDYLGGTGGDLLIPDKTCIDITNLGPQDAARKIAWALQPDNLAEMCENARRRFAEVVNFDEEFVRIKEFLARLA